MAAENDSTRTAYRRCLSVASAGCDPDCRCADHVQWPQASSLGAPEMFSPCNGCEKIFATELTLVTAKQWKTSLCDTSVTDANLREVRLPVQHRGRLRRIPVLRHVPVLPRSPRKDIRRLFPRSMVFWSMPQAALPAVRISRPPAPLWRRLPGVPRVSRGTSGGDMTSTGFRSESERGRTTAVHPAAQKGRFLRFCLDDRSHRTPVGQRADTSCRAAISTGSR